MEEVRVSFTKDKFKNENLRYLGGDTEYFSKLRKRSAVLEIDIYLYCPLQ